MASLKGLRLKATQARANIDALNKAYDAFNQQSTDHVAEVEGMAIDLGDMQSDLDFATRTLGNSAAAETSEQQSTGS